MNCDIFKLKDNDTKHLKKVYANHHITLGHNRANQSNLGYQNTDRSHCHK